MVYRVGTQPLFNHWDCFDVFSGRCINHAEYPASEWMVWLDFVSLSRLFQSFVILAGDVIRPGQSGAHINIERFRVQPTPYFGDSFVEAPHRAEVDLTVTKMRRSVVWIQFDRPFERALGFDPIPVVDGQ